MDPREQIEEILATIAKNEKIDSFITEIGDGNKRGEGFLGELVFATIKDNNSPRALDLAIKRAFMSEEARSKVPIRLSFENEVNVYLNIWPVLENFQKSFNIENPFNNLPKCYLASLAEGNEFLVMENLKKQGFELFPKTNIFSLELASFIFETYGRYHALSLAFRKQNPETFKDVVSTNVDMFDVFFKRPSFKSSLNKQINAISELLKPGSDDKLIEAFKKYVEDGLQIYKKSYQYKGNYPVLCHGDCWSNNFMFKLDADKKVTEMKVLDWQVAKIGSVVHDLAYCLYSGASKEVYDRLDDLLKVYHKSLSKTLKEMGEDANELFPFDALKEEWREYSVFGLLISFIVIKIKLLPTEEVVQFQDEGNSSILDGKADSSMDKRLIDLITHSYEIGVL